ncbi:AAA family ATPase [Micromonospora sp. NPDC023888]|uniref:AAA family ATPase n=1 Tax=Micromonospora sp. NPDC023888 TaxID=3155607 RepID=UPI0033FCF2EA
MPQLLHLNVKGLFQFIDHDISFSADAPVTILSGPNGIGKTHILRLIKALLDLDLLRVGEIPFQAAHVLFSNKRSLLLEKVEEGGRLFLRVSGSGPRGAHLGTTRVPVTTNLANLPPWVVRLDNGRWYDIRPAQPRPLPRSFIQRQFGIEGDPFEEAFVVPPWLAEVMLDGESVFIDTKRLDTLARTEPGHLEHASEVTHKSRIEEYIRQIQIQVSEAKTASLAATQSADESFAARVLQGARTTVKESFLKARYQKVAEQASELYRNGLSAAVVDVDFPSSKTNPTERRVLAVFLDDWENRLFPLLPVNEKLKTLRSIVINKFIGKDLRVAASGVPTFFSTVDESEIGVTSLSSGEQHLLALFTMLLFSTKERSVVLIDEPEISLHAAWKHAFLQDISDVARIAHLQVVIATHSSGIINGRWDLVQELGAE